jgi:2'-5' RNA ligase
MPRLFTALEVPSDIAFSLSLLRGGLPGARWVDPENYHITLRFIGDIDQPTADEIIGALTQVDRPRFDLSLESLDALGSRKAQAIVASVKRSSALSELQAEHERIIQRIGLEPERRRYRPHVTIARMKGASEADIASYLALRGNFRTPSFPVGRFVLLSSRASKGGGPYLVEEAYPLAA